MTYHSDIVRQQGLLQFYTPLMTRFLSKMDRIVATSPNYQQSSEVLQNYKDKVTAVPIGIDEASYPILDHTVLESCREKFGENFFFFIGVLRYYKGLHILIDACRNADFKVVIAGAGPLEAELKQQVKDLGLDNVVFAGRVTDAEKVALFTLSRGVVFASHVRSEAFGVTLLEGAMLGKPLITAETGTGTSYVNDHGVTGLVVAPDNALALNAAMTSLHEDDVKAQDMGAKSRQRYEMLFTGKQMGKTYAEIYRELLNDKLQDAEGRAI